jgi:hypothetical protein
MGTPPKKLRGEGMVGQRPVGGNRAVSAESVADLQTDLQTIASTTASTAAGNGLSRVARREKRASASISRQAG